MGEGSATGKGRGPLESVCPGEGSTRGLTKECVCPGEGSTHGEWRSPYKSRCPGEGSAPGEWFLL